eukprot:4523405-Prymnesium_polylepis.1
MAGRPVSQPGLGAHIAYLRQEALARGSRDLPATPHRPAAARARRRWEARAVVGESGGRRRRWKVTAVQGHSGAKARAVVGDGGG